MWEPETTARAALARAKDNEGNAVEDDCGAALCWEPSGTLQVCTDPGCPDRDEPVFPLALMSRSRPADDLRREATRDELLDQELALEGRREQLRALVRERLADDGLHPETRGHLGVFARQIDQAAGAKQLGWLAERLFALPVRKQAAPRPVIQAQVIQAEVISDEDQGEDVARRAAGTGGPGLRELGREAVASLDGGAGPGRALALVPRLALPPGGPPPAYYTPLGWCDRCAELRQQGRRSGPFGVAVVRVEFRGQDELRVIDGKPQPVLCGDCWEWLQATEPAGSYMVTGQAEMAARRPVRGVLGAGRMV